MNERLDYLREKTYLLTTAPGVYQMKDKTGHIIYIGKAKNLRNRVSSYFAKTPNHTPKVAKMVENVYDYDFIVTTFPRPLIHALRRRCRSPKQAR